ncbi:ALDH-like protein [Bimuria novae-zelandiae CBS 107.79]|uniref:ALDH-like protein n=1 Tax=Bimuria novae-zelandiae CBS 107.79 TaxID=1447943 RepID=A0A6A5V2D9_9PLEO|nr:ALDH-like protein [Bimuria novae-zelandiae CBS 107.79]
MPLAAGCSIVVKASELCPRTHHLLLEAFEEAGIPSGVINMIQERREDAAAVTEATVAHQALRKVDFISSAAVGSKMGQLCAKYLKPILIELGGKGPAEFLEDADLGQAAKLCAHAYDVLSDAQDKGATFLASGLQYLSETSLKPTLVINVSHNARIFDEETFGPSASVYMTESEDHAVEKANDSVYGLNAAVHNKSWEHALEIAKRLGYGQVHVNDITCNDAPGVPIKGVEGSGWGTSNLIWGIEEFTVQKSIYFHPSGGVNMFDKH